MITDELPAALHVVVLNRWGERYATDGGCAEGRTICSWCGQLTSLGTRL
jgi:hypothetical protein